MSRLRSSSQSERFLRRAGERSRRDRTSTRVAARRWVGAKAKPQRHLRQRTPADRVEAVLRLRRLRMTAAKIAEVLRMARSTVSLILMRAGRPRAPSRLRRRPQPRRLRGAAQRRASADGCRLPRASLPPFRRPRHHDRAHPRRQRQLLPLRRLRHRCQRLQIRNGRSRAPRPRTNGGRNASSKPPPRMGLRTPLRDQQRTRLNAPDLDQPLRLPQTTRQPQPPAARHATEQRA
jgi:hypothetical protein